MEGSVLSFLKAEWKVSDHEPLVLLRSRSEYYNKTTNQKQELPVVAIFVNGSGQNEQSL
jgi:hypothetical protein